MTIAITLLLFAIGLALIIKGGDAFVEAASRLAAATGIPKFIIGATIVSVATTLPEITVSLLATVHGEREIAIGNAVGSVCCNIGLILGLALLLRPPKVHKQELRSKGLLMAGATAFLWAFTLNGHLSLLESLVLLGIFGYFLFSSVQQSKDHREEREKISRRQGLWEICVFVLGATAIVLGAHLLVQNGVILAGLLGISDEVIGLTMIAVGTSLPELITALTAIRKNESSLSVGNIFGANIIDITLILAACTGASGGGLEMAAATAWVDLPVCLGLMGVVLLPAWRKGKMKRWQGGTLLALYGIYVVCLVVTR